MRPEAGKKKPCSTGKANTRIPLKHSVQIWAGRCYRCDTYDRGLLLCAHFIHFSSSLVDLFLFRPPSDPFSKMNSILYFFLVLLELMQLFQSKSGKVGHEKMSNTSLALGYTPSSSVLSRMLKPPDCKTRCEILNGNSGWSQNYTLCCL